MLLATGENFTLNLDNFNVELTGNEMASLIENDGVILSNDRIELTAKGKEMAKDIAINNNGILEANSIAIEGGKILLGNNSDIRYGKNHTSGAELTITQVGKAEGNGVKISGKITALTNVKKANAQNNQYNNRFKKNELALDEKGDVYYTASDYTLKTAKKVDQGLQSADGNLYIYQKNGVFEILAKGAYQDYQASAGGAELASNIRKPALQMAYQKPILTINYLEKENNVSNVETHLGAQLDPVNAKIAEQIKAQIDAGNLVFLKPDEISKIASQVIEEQKNALLAKTKLSENELKTQLNGNLSSITVGNETHKREGLIFTEKLQQFAQELDQKNQVDTSHSTTFDDLKLLASLLDRTASFGENREATQTAYVSADKKTLKVVRVDEKLADKLQRKLALPLTTIQADSAINIENATFTHNPESQHNLLLLTAHKNTDSNTFTLNNVTFDLGKGSVGIGNAQTPQPLQEETLLLKEMNGKTQPLYTLSGKALEPKTTQEILQSIQLTDFADYISFTNKEGAKINFTGLWQSFLNHIGTQEIGDLNNQGIYSFALDQFYQFASEKANSVDKRQIEIILQRSNLANGALYNKFTKKEPLFETAKSVQTIAGLSTKQPTFNVALNDVNFTSGKDFVIADGFKDVSLNRVKTNGEIGIFINSGNMRTYTAQSSNLASPETKQGYEYVIADLKERVLRGGFPLPDKRYNLLDEQGTKRSKREFATAFVDWVTSEATARSYIKDTHIQINDSQLNSQEGFIHLFAENIDLDNSTLSVNYSKPLYESFMQNANKLALNGQNIGLKNSKLTVKGADTYGSSALAPAAGIFLVGDILGESSEIYAKTFQGYSIRTYGNTILRGKNTPTDLTITAINTGHYAEPDVGLGTFSNDNFLDAVAFHPGDASRTSTVLDNITLNALAPNGARAFESMDTTNHPNAVSIKVKENAIMNYYEQPRVFSFESNVVAGKARSLTPREHLQLLDRIENNPITQLGAQIDSAQSVHYNLPTEFEEDITIKEEPLIDLCETDETGKSQCHQYSPSQNSKVSIGEISEL